MTTHPRAVAAQIVRVDVARRQRRIETAIIFAIWFATAFGAAALGWLAHGRLA